MFKAKNAYAKQAEKEHTLEVCTVTIPKKKPTHDCFAIIIVI